MLTTNIWHGMGAVNLLKKNGIAKTQINSTQSWIGCIIGKKTTTTTPGIICLFWF
jgi:hypothetical protein